MKQTKRLNYNLKRPTINLTDIKQVADTITSSGIKDSPTFSVTFYDDPSTSINYDSVDEIVPTVRRVKELIMHARIDNDSASYSSLMLFLTPSRHYITMEETSPKQRGIFESVKDVLKPCEHRTRWLVSKLEYTYVLIIAGLLVSAIALTSPNSQRQPHAQTIRVLLRLLVVAIVLGLIRLYTYGVLKLGRGHTIRLQSKEQAKGYFGKNGAELTTHIIGATIAGIILLLVGYFWGKR